MPSLINNLTNFADQVTALQLPDGTTADMGLLYNAATERWSMNLAYGDFLASGVGVCCYPNLLRQWRNILPFGLAFVSDNQTDPFTVDDFASGRVQVYLLTEIDVADVEATIFGPAAVSS